MAHFSLVAQVFESVANNLSVARKNRQNALLHRKLAQPQQSANGGKPSKHSPLSRAKACLSVDNNGVFRSEKYTRKSYQGIIMQSKLSKVTLLILLLAIALTTLLLPLQAFAATSSSRPTSAEEVNYVKNGDYVYNWGIRGEPAAFLSKYAQEFYTGNYTFDKLSKVGGGSSQSNAPSSVLYEKLQKLMKDNHSYKTSYEATKNLYRYTDCESSNKSNISSFYSGKSLSSSWGNGWNREHTWPNSKGLNGQDENDIMMLRPTWVQENSSRGNTAYGQSSGYFNPDCENPPASLKGDVARICLYVYTRWGNTGRMWGTSGVMESLTILLQWMEQDPVDTWEMGRNDAVQSITGTRNVFVDYPEYAWLLFGKDVPNTVYTPSQSNGVQAPDPDLSGSGSTGGDSTGGDSTGGSTGGSTTPAETVHAGTKADPYTVADALAVGNSLSSSSCSEKVYIKATVKSSGEKTTSSSGSTYLKNVVVSDSSTTETLRAYTLNPNSAADLELKVGDTVLIYGYIRIYNGEIEIGSNLNDRTDYSYFSIVTDTTGGSGDIEISPDNAIEVFKTAVAEASNTATVNGKYSAIKTAVTAYNMLTAEQKQQVSTEFAMLKTAIESYNSAISKQNENSTNALKYSLQLVATTAVALAVVIFTKKVLFK